VHQGEVLAPVLNLAKLATMSAAISAFENGTVMYWLKFFSMYNAKKSDVAAVTVDAAKTT